MSSTEIRKHRETVFLRLLLRVSQAETGELVKRLQALGHRDVQPSYVGLLGNVDTEGTRVSTIAHRTGNTRQAVSQLVAAISAAGYVERLPDPDDGRAILIRHTKRGRALLADALQAMADIEAEYEAVIGTPRMRTVKKALTEIATVADPTSGLAHR